MSQFRKIWQHFNDFKLFSSKNCLPNDLFQTIFYEISFVQSPLDLLVSFGELYLCFCKSILKDGKFFATFENIK